MVTKDEVEPTLQLLRNVLEGIASATGNIRELNADEGAVEAAVEISDGTDLVQQVQNAAGELAELVAGWPDLD